MALFIISFCIISLTYQATYAKLDCILHSSYAYVLAMLLYSDYNIPKAHDIPMLTNDGNFIMSCLLLI